MRVIMFSGARERLIKNTLQITEIRVAISDILHTENPDLIIVGCATGVDKIVRDLYKGIPGRYYVAQFVADWPNHGRPAGMIRNREMCESMNILGGTRLYAFPATNSKGTWSCIRTALHHNLDVIISPILYS